MWKDGLYEGKGQAIYNKNDDQHSFYSGEFSKGKWVEGELEFTNGDKYTGEFMLDKPHGKGVKVFADGFSLEGTFIGPHGSGIGQTHITW